MDTDLTVTLSIMSSAVWLGSWNTSLVATTGSALVPSIPLVVGMVLVLDSYRTLTELAKLLQRPNRSIVSYDCNIR